MNIQEYIASGILETYFLGELSSAEQAEVEKNVAEYPEIRAELDRIPPQQPGNNINTRHKPLAVEFDYSVSGTGRNSF